MQTWTEGLINNIFVKGIQETLKSFKNKQGNNNLFLKYNNNSSTVFPL